ncbi:acyl-ACP--UDP-N- acetylglucosamine O-acyltransferase [Actinobacillus pleuropneumoniae]|uniref:Acyl-ACP--UDP-N-acetylglucosamine O-acyltransferase n=2 Tax=Actinobacillus pleuropneumoniae TaxID=715 RepID=A0ABN5MJD3_ACTPL|nr:hypothetical protein [Actinobacillus pleuropneumoniae]AWG95626.1 acyl-ACP--UDP-N- acetylglucosamine O-acyltransferase [Actinobacillus pleuropneumoniae serovar 1 str. 4074]EFM98327.1 acyl--UDP-N-acetylglucosamine O-acyltransferase [Actinobacillus pleuropneumoniae serovar 11 str. 56153]AXA21696.1 acyl-ACP--UDP-N- acetylglucosamine O-acyltransferase [Actinobacillus pleuropneumoniae]EFM93940.1 acyl--UDP-N-acetylglucosamine O-acyltransferase [Actinobacillus pleuropneumoniae serovar 9 str. CVJ1326
MMERKKYCLTENYIEKYGRILYQIQALQDFSYVKAGELGGFIESEDNLSQADHCWVACGVLIYGNAKVLDNAIVSGNVEICDHAQIYGYAKVDAYGGSYAFINDNVEIFGYAYLSISGCDISQKLSLTDNVKVFDNARIDGGIHIFNNAQIYGNAHICGAGRIWDNTKIFGNAHIMNIFGYFKIAGNAEISGGYITDSAGVIGNAKVRNGQIYGSSKILGNAIIDEKAVVRGSANIGNNAYLKREEDCFCCVMGKNNYEISFYNTLNDGIWVSYVNEFDEEKIEHCSGIDDFLTFAKQHYAEKEYREFELLVALVKSRILGK